MSSDSNQELLGKQNVFSEKGSEVATYSGGGGFHHQRSSMEAVMAKQAMVPPQMTNKMKGLLKGLRYISQIFEPNEKEQEMQIGFPTDVKHVAHIGWDGPALSQPSWMNEFKSMTDFSELPSVAAEQESPNKKISQGSRQVSNGSQDSPGQGSPVVPKAPRRSQQSGAPDSPNGVKTDAPRTSRRRQSAATATATATGETSDVPRQPRRQSHKAGTGSPTKDTSKGPKQPRKKKSSRSDGGSMRPSRSKALIANSDADENNTEQSPALKSPNEEK